MIHIIESCPRTKFADQELTLHKTDDNVVARRRGDKGIRKINK